MPRYRSALAALPLLSVGCLIDHDRCDAHEVEVHGDYAICVCEPNAVFSASGAGCTPCAANEEVQNGACACKQGFARTSADAGCEMSTAGLHCSASEPCGAAYPYCVMTSATDGYCSLSGCSTNADCPTGWSCEANGDTRFCHQPPTGLGAMCKSDADCAAFEANQCETLLQHQCILKGCAEGATTCPNEWACCDYSGLLGAPLSICAPPSQLTAGACPMGGVRTNP